MLVGFLLYLPRLRRRATNAVAQLYLREIYEVLLEATDGTTYITHIPTDEMVADLLTHPVEVSVSILDV